MLDFSIGDLFRQELIQADSDYAEALSLRSDPGGILQCLFREAGTGRCIRLGKAQSRRIRHKHGAQVHCEMALTVTSIQSPRVSLRTGCSV